MGNLLKYQSLINCSFVEFFNGLAPDQVFFWVCLCNDSKVSLLIGWPAPVTQKERCDKITACVYIHGKQDLVSRKQFKLVLMVLDTFLIRACA